MVCGYIEEPHSVVKEHTIDDPTDPGATQLFAHCQPNSQGVRNGVAVSSSAYIRIEFISPDGKTWPQFLHFDPGNEEKLEACWAQLLADPLVQIDDLPWDELVSADLGKRKDGSIIMY